MAKLTGIKAVLADRKRLAKWKASPGLRSKLPDEVLTREQRLQRRLHRPVFDGGPTGFDVARGARTATDLAYEGQRQALKEERTQVAAQRMRNAGWWDQYQNMLRSQVGSVQANPTVSPNVLGQYGARPDAGTVGVQQGAQGAQAALASLANGLLAAQAQNVTQQKMESLAGLDAKELALTRKSGDLEREAGLFKQQQREKIVGDAWQKLLEGKAFNLRAATAQATIDDKKADNKRAGQQWARTTNKYGVTNGAWADWPQAKRDQWIKASGRKSDPTTQLAPDNIHTKAEWLAASVGQRRKWLAQAKKTKGTTKSGDRPATPEQQGKSPYLSTKDQLKFWQKVDQAKALWGTPVLQEGIPTGKKWDAKSLQAAGFSLAHVRLANSLRVNKGGISRRDLNTLHGEGIQLKNRYKIVKK